MGWDNAKKSYQSLIFIVVLQEKVNQDIKRYLKVKILKLKQNIHISLSYLRNVKPRFPFSLIR